MPAWVDSPVPTAHPGHWLGPLIKLGRLGPAQPIPVGLDLAPKKIKKMDPVCPTCVTKGMFGKNTPLYLGHNFYAHSSWYLAKQALFWYQKILKIFEDLRCFICDPLTLYFIFFFVFCIFLVICSIYGPTLLNTKFVVQCLYYFHLIRANDNKC